MKSAITLLFCSILLPSIAYAGPLGKYYFERNNSIYTLQGSTVTHVMNIGGNQDAFGVTDQWLSTAGFHNNLAGNRYDHNGNVISGPHINTGQQYLYDGTWDGQYHYALAALDSTVYRFDENWQNAVALFHAGHHSRGITFDPLNNSLWLTDTYGQTAINYTMSGTVLSSFSTAPLFRATALAMDYTDGTLWMHDTSLSNHFYQFDRAGNLLSSEHYGNYIGGGEFILPSAVPEPSTYALLALGCLALWRRKKRS